MVNMEHAWLLPALPAAAFVILALFQSYLPRKGDFVAIAAIVASFIAMLMVAGDLFDQIPSADFVMHIGFHVDQLTMVMLLCVTFVGMLVQIYSTGYMAHTDERGHK